VTEKAWTEESRNKCEELEMKLRKCVHAPGCTSDPALEYRICPQQCGCDPELNDFTAMLWKAADVLRHARDEDRTHMLHALLCGAQVLYDAVNRHHDPYKEPPAMLLWETVQTIRIAFIRSISGEVKR